MEQVVVDFSVEVALLPEAAGGRHGAIHSGYRPNHKDPLTGDFFMGALTFADGVSLVPGNSAPAHLRIVALPSQVATLQAFGSWTIWEGPAHHIGSVRLLAV